MPRAGAGRLGDSGVGGRGHCRRRAGWGARGERGARSRGISKPTPRIYREEIRPWRNSGLGETIPAGFNMDPPPARKPWAPGGRVPSLRVVRSPADTPTPGGPCSDPSLSWTHPSAPRRGVPFQAPHLFRSALHGGGAVASSNTEADSLHGSVCAKEL